MRARLTNAFRMQFSEKYFRNDHRLYQLMLMRMLRFSDGGVDGEMAIESRISQLHCTYNNLCSWELRPPFICHRPLLNVIIGQ